MLNQSMNIIALDIGDVHTGIARSDALGMFATPYKTIATKTLTDWVDNFLKQQAIPATIVIGYPKTMRNTASEQTNKVITHHKNLAAQFPQATWVLWDERLSSHQAKQLIGKKIRQNKLYEHAAAAAIILQAYLEQIHFKKTC